MALSENVSQVMVSPTTAGGRDHMLCLVQQWNNLMEYFSRGF
jgi:hypothetical protein